MITDDMLEELIARTAHGFDPPPDGPAAIRRAATASAGEAPVAGGRGREHRRILFGAGGIAAVGALVAWLALAGGSTQIAGPNRVAASSAEGARPGTRTPGLGALRNGNVAAGTYGALPLAPNLAGPSRRQAGSTRAVPAGSPLIVATGSVVIEAARGHFSGDVARLDSLASSLGGYVSGASLSEVGSNQGGTVVLAVPASAFASAVARVEAIGPVRDISRSESDVTSQVVDLAARLEALEDARAQLESFLAQAASVSDLLAVENQVENVQTSIEQIEGQQRSLASEVAYSRLSVVLQVPGSARPAKPAAANSFAGAWDRSTSGFLDGVRWFVAAIGPLLFGLLAATVALLIALVLWRLFWPAFRRRSV